MVVFKASSPWPLCNSFGNSEHPIQLSMHLTDTFLHFLLPFSQTRFSSSSWIAGLPPEGSRRSHAAASPECQPSQSWHSRRNRWGIWWRCDELPAPWNPGTHADHTVWGRGIAANPRLQQLPVCGLVHHLCSSSGTAHLHEVLSDLLFKLKCLWSAAWSFW